MQIDNSFVLIGWERQGTGTREYGGDRRREPGAKRTGRLWEAGEEREGSGVPKVAGAGRNKIKILNITSTSSKAQRDGNHEN